MVRGPRETLLNVDPLPKACSSSDPSALHHHPAVALLAMNIAALQKTSCPTLVERAHGGDSPFFSPQMYGKWYDIAVGTTCKWMKNYKEKFSMGTLVLGPGPSVDQISTASTRLRYGCCRGCSSLPQSHPSQGCSVSPRLGQDVGVACSGWHRSHEEGLHWA